MNAKRRKSLVFLNFSFKRFGKEMFHQILLYSTSFSFNQLKRCQHLEHFCIV